MNRGAVLIKDNNAREAPDIQLMAIVLVIINIVIIIGCDWLSH